MITLRKIEADVLKGIQAEKAQSVISEELGLWKSRTARIYAILKQKGAIEHLSHGRYRVVDVEYELLKPMNRAEKKEQAQEIFERYELELFFSMKKDRISKPSMDEILEEIEAAGISPTFARRFLTAQMKDMREQLAEQEAG